MDKKVLGQMLKKVAGSQVKMNIVIPIDGREKTVKTVHLLNTVENIQEFAQRELDAFKEDNKYLSNWATGEVTIKLTVM